MTRLVLFAPEVPPCVPNPREPEWTVCGRLIGGAHTITEVQALVFYRDGRCRQCAPLWHGSGKGRRS